MTVIDIKNKYAPIKLDISKKINILKKLKQFEKFNANFNKFDIDNVIITKNKMTIGELFYFLKSNSNKSTTTIQINKLVIKKIFDYIRIYC